MTLSTRDRLIVTVGNDELPPEVDPDRLRLAEWLRGAGGTPPSLPTGYVGENEAQEYEHRFTAWCMTRTPAQRTFIRAAMLDDDWRRFLGYDPLPTWQGEA